MTRPTLPQAYATVPDVVQDDCSTFSNWSIYSGSGVLVSDTAHVKNGTSSVKITFTGDVMIQRLSATLNFQTAKAVGFWLYLENAAGLNYVYLRCLWSGGVSSKVFRNAFGYFVDGWNFFVWHKGDNSAITGDQRWEVTQLYNQYRVCLGTFAGQTVSASIDSVISHSAGIPNVVFTIDDGLHSIYELLYPELHAAGMAATMYCSPNLVGLTVFCTLEELKELYADGWDIANHTMSHNALTTLSDSEIVSNLTGVSEWLIANDMPRGAYHFCYPSAAFNQHVNSVVAPLMLTATTANDRGMLPPYFEHENIGRNGYMNGDTTFATAKALIDNAIATKTTLLFYIHGIAVVGSSTNMTLSVMQEIIAYVKMLQDHGAVRCVTLSEWYNGLTNPRYRTMPATRTPR